MAVTFTTKFYQASAWNDISKIVYTSPNMESPNTVGTRSHILPGEGDLGLWYEDTSNMYRIETSQEETETCLYDYIVSTTTEIDTITPSSSVTVTGTSDTYDVFYDYIKRSVGCTPIDYDALWTGGDDYDEVVTETRVKLQYTGGVIEWLYNDDISYGTGEESSLHGWSREQITGEIECYIDIDLDKPRNITKMYMREMFSRDGDTYDYRYFIGNFTIYGKLDLNDEWVELYTGVNSDNSGTHSMYLTGNDNFFQYYRILIESNSSLNAAFDDSMYGISSLKFYEYNYNNIPTRTKPMYHFRQNGDTDIIYISDIEYGPGTDFILDIDSVVTSNSGTLTLASGTALAGWGALAGSVDYQTDDSVVFEITVGEAYNCRLTAWDDVTHSTVLNELIANDHVRCSALAYCCSNSKNTPNESFDPINYVWGPVHNRILKGNTVYMGQNLFYGDFDMVYRYQDDVYGDYLIFKPMLYGIDESLSYGVHDFIMTLHYSYT